MHPRLKEFTEDHPGQRPALLKKTATLEIHNGTLAVIGDTPYRSASCRPTQLYFSSFSFEKPSNNPRKYE